MRRLLVTSALLGLIIGLLPGSAMANTYNSSAAPTWVPNGQVWAMAVTPSRIYLGGDFTSLRNPVTGAVVNRNHLAAIDRSTGNPSSWGPSVIDAGTVDSGQESPPVTALLVGPGNVVYVGGDFNSIGGKARTFAAAVNKDGVVLDSFNPVLDARVWDFALAGSSLYMAGQFANVGAVTRRGVARVNATTGVLDASWNADLIGRAQAIALSGNTVYLGGTFDSIHGRPQPFLGSVTSATGADTGWNPTAQCVDIVTPCRTRDLAVDSSRVYAAVGGEPGGLALAYGLGNTVDLKWKFAADGDVQTVKQYDGVVYFGGHFNKKFGTATRNQFAAINPTGAGSVLPYALPFVAPASPGLWALHADSQGLFIGGGGAIDANHRNFLAFAHPGVVIAGPIPVTKVTVKTKGCKTCKVRLTENRGSGAAYTTAWVKAKKGTAVFTVPTSRTVGLTVQVDAPWEKKQKKTAEVVMRYQGQGVGNKVTPKEASKGKKASSCYAGTSAKALTFSLKVGKVKSGSKVGTRAYVTKTQSFRNPTRKSPKGVLTTKKPTKCS